ncbi:MAG: acetyl-CoA hydrolase/transferase C-terminal domain-containing protein [Dehalococcoidia bacterium]|nr:acetyl-CoA hydrolase/transferase C-terminal domain-containing protein [Dehalococcoidia bacterium]
MPATTIQAALNYIQSGMRVYLHGGAATPTPLIEALAERALSLTGVETVSLHLEGPAPHVAPALEGHLRHNALFIGANVREAVNAGRADFTPVFLSDIPRLFTDGTLPLDVALLQVSPPDADGMCSMGVSVDVARPAAEAARFVIAEVNRQMPRTLGESTVHLSQIDAYIETDRPLWEIPPPDPTEVSRRIGEHVATLVEDGATLQLGIGAVADAVLRALRGHRDLGIHTEMFADGVVDLVEAGVITGARKAVHPGLIVSSFVMGTRRLYDFVDGNPGVAMFSSAYTNDTRVIAQHEEMVAVNSAIEVDLTGQVCADSIGPRFWSGIGGQLDFIRGAARAPRGRPIIALPSSALGGTRSRIVSQLAAGAGVVTTRGDVYFVVTEHGIARLHGRPVRERAQALIDIAAPAFREQLAREASALYGFRLHD